MIRRVSPGSTCAATRAIAPTGAERPIRLPRPRLSPGGYEGLENPDLDARDADPDWLPDPATLVGLGPAVTGDAPPFDLWALPGRKSLIHDGRRLLLRTRVGRRVTRVAISLTLRDGAPYAFAVPAGAARRERTLWAADLAEMLDNSAAEHRGRGAVVSRSAIVHMRALQALDAEAAGASERALARLIFGSAEADATWNASPTRAKVRYILRHGRALRDGGYRQLLAAIE